MSSENDITSFIFPDIQAINSIKYEFPPSLMLLEEASLCGFEIYLVEQWLSERRLSTAITTYTGSDHDVIKAYRLTMLSNDESLWPATLKAYIGELVELAKCKSKEADGGLIFVTSLSQVPSNLNLVEVQDGDMNQVWDIFNINLNLKKMGCSGRSVLTLFQPSKSIQDKFRQMFKISPEVDVGYAAREMVLIVQTFLYYYKVFPANFCDGILCNKTEDSLHLWWDQIGIHYFDFKPSAGEFFTPMTVSAIISFTLNMKMRLELLNTSSIDVPKDPLNVEKFRLAIGQFQKYSAKFASTASQPSSAQHTPSASVAWSGAVNMNDEYSYFLDQVTIENLMAYSNHKMNNQQFKNDLNKVKKLLKNTVNDISSGRTYLNLSSSNAALPFDASSTNLHDIENLKDCLTADIEKMIIILQGKRLLYLWRGKGKPVSIDEVSLAKSIRDQLTRQLRHSEMNSRRLSDAKNSIDSETAYMGRLAADRIRKGSDNTGGSSHITRHRSVDDMSIYHSSDLYGIDDNQYMNGRLSRSDAHRKGSTHTTEDWLFLDNDANFDSQLSRRSSFPSVHNELNRSLVLYRRELPAQEHSTTHKHLPTDDGFANLRRSNSFSLLEDSILVWDYPFSPSVNRLALDYLRVKENLDVNINNANEAFTDIVTEMEAALQSNNPVTLNIPGAGARRVKRALDTKTIEELHHRASSKKEFLDLRLKDIDLLNSRLAYEVRLLSSKVKDLEENLKQLQDFKLKKVVENLSLYQYQRPELQDHLLKYQELQHTLEGTNNTTDDLKDNASTTFIDRDKKDTILATIGIYLLAVWHDILKLFSAQHKMNDVFASEEFDMKKYVDSPTT